MDKVKSGLELLNYPHINSVSQDTICCASKMRYDLLDWLFNQFDSDIFFCLIKNLPVENETEEERVKRLTLCAASLGLAGPEDYVILRAECGVPFDCQFLSELIELALVHNQIDFGSKDLNEYNEQDRVFVETLVPEFNQIFTSSCNLFPHDINKRITKDKNQIIPHEVLQKQVKKLQEKINQTKQEISQLNENAAWQNHQVISAYQQEAATALQELSQSMKSFNETYQQHFGAWATSSAPQSMVPNTGNQQEQENNLSPIGPLSSQTIKLVQTLKKTSIHLEEIWNTYHSLSTENNSQNQKYAIPETGEKQFGAQAAGELLESTRVLDESLKRKK